MGKRGGVEVLARVGRGEGEMGRWGGVKGSGRRGRGQRVTEFSDFVHPCNAGYPS